MAKKRKRKKPQSEYIRRKRKTKSSRPRLVRIREDKLRTMIRAATHSGLTAAIEHCYNFWSVGDQYKKYIDHQVTSQAEALMAAVKTALHDELAQVRRHKRRTKTEATAGVA